MTQHRLFWDPNIHLTQIHFGEAVLAVGLRNKQLAKTGTSIMKERKFNHLDF